MWIICQPKQLPRSISRLVVACIYLPPNLSHDKIEQAYDYLLDGYDKLITESPDSAFVITGDFNPNGNGFEPKTLSIHCKLKQIVRSPTRNEATLDLIFTNIQDFYSEPSISAPLGTSDHACVKLQSLNEVYVGNLKRKVKVRPIKDSSLTSFRSWLSNFDWSNVCSITALDEKVDEFTNILTNAIEAFFPTKLIKFCNDKPFITGRIKYLISKRDQAYKKKNQSCYKHYRNKVAYEIKKEKYNFYDSKVKAINTKNSKQWWKTVKQICNLKRSASFSLLNNETNEPLTKHQMAEYINSFFSSLTSQYPPVSPSRISSGPPLPYITEELVVNRLKTINQNKAPGPFDPPLKIIKSAADLLGPVLCNIINHSFSNQEFPNLWKIFDICPIPKIVPVPSVETLRPIALTSIFSKIQESFAVEWMMEDISPVISPAQYGGLPGLSTTHALLNLLHNWYKALEKSSTISRL